MNSTRKNLAFFLLGALGFSSVVIWADLLGHSSGFALATSGVQNFGNARIFFLFGFTGAALVSSFIPRFNKQVALSLRIAIPLMGSIGTLLFGISYEQSLFSPQPIAVIALIFCGISYYGTAVLFFLELAKTKRISTAIWIIAVSLFLKTLLADVIGLCIPNNYQVLFAAALPPIALICVVALHMINPSNPNKQLPTSTLSDKSTKDLIYFFIAASVITAALRGFSHLGLWGTGYIGSSVSTVWGYALVGAFLTSFTFIALTRNCNDQALKRFQPSFLVLISGFLAYIILSQIDSAGLEYEILTDFFVASELFGHLLLRSVVFSAMRTTTIPGWRLQGLSDAAYGITSILWAFLLQDALVSVQLLVIVALFFSMAATVRPFNKSPHETELVLSDAQHPTDNSSTQKAQSGDTQNAEDVFENVARFHKHLSAKHGLSPRETDVFLLLAQGRSRPYISQELYVSDGTVKTHIAHIYKKLEVSSKQELLTKIQEEQVRWSEHPQSDEPEEMQS